MDKLTISFVTENTPNFDILINGLVINYEIVNNQIIIQQDVLFGLNLIKIKLIQGSKVIINDLMLNDVSVRQTLYLAYNENLKVNSTWLTTQRPELVIPFGNPLSWWIGLCNKKIPNLYYGKNLYEFYDIYYPESIEINDQFPRLMRDFMRYNFDFCLVKKEKQILHNKNLPWIKINLNYNEQALFNEFNRNQDLLSSNYYKPKQNLYNIKEKNSQQWEVAMAIHDNLIIEYTEKDFPEFFKLINYIRSENIHILHAYIGKVNTNGYVAPHVDDHYKHETGYEHTSGCSQFFIPIGWRAGNYLKFDGVGFIPFEQSTYIVNNSDFMHGSVNVSDTPRFTIGIYCIFTEENLQKLIQK